MSDDDENFAREGTAGSSPLSNPVANRTNIKNVNAYSTNTKKRYGEKKNGRESHASSASDDAAGSSNDNIEINNTSADTPRRPAVDSSDGYVGNDSNHSSGHNNGKNNNGNNSEGTPSQIFFRSWPDPRLGMISVRSTSIRNTTNRLSQQLSPQQNSFEVEQNRTEPRRRPEIRNNNCNDNQPQPTKVVERQEGTIAIPLAVAVPFAVVEDGSPISDGYPLVEAVAEIDNDGRTRTPNSEVNGDIVFATCPGPLSRHMHGDFSVEANESDVCGEEGGENSDGPSCRVDFLNCLKITFVWVCVAALVFSLIWSNA